MLSDKKETNKKKKYYAGIGIDFHFKTCFVFRGEARKVTFI